MVCYGNYFKDLPTNPDSGLNEVDVEKHFGQGEITDIGARYYDRYLMIED